VTAVRASDDKTGARPGARRVLRHRRLGWLAAIALLAGCETGPELVQNSVAQCIAHIKLPQQYAAPFCRCLGSELESHYSYAQIRQYQLATDNWTYFKALADDAGLMRINQVCLARHVPEDLR
jgi:hypothetical protein